MEAQKWTNCRESEDNLVDKSNLKNQRRIKTLTQAKPEEIMTVKANLKAQLPALTALGVRRHRLPHHESILLELRENGFKDSVDFMKMLYDKDATSQNLDKKLITQRHLLDKIKIGLINAELARRKRKNVEQTIALLDTAIFFQSLTPEWLWIADRFFKSSLIVSSRVDEDAGEILNIVKYVYGKFLFKQMKELHGAICLLEEVRKASKGKRWNASRFFNKQEGNLFKESNSVLHEVLITLAGKSIEKHVDTAVMATVRALECARDTGSEELIAEALLEVGRAKMRSGKIGEAVQNFSKYLAIVKRIPDVNGMCDGHRELAVAHKAIKNTAGVEKHLEMFKEVAEKSGLLMRLAEAEYCLGEFMLEQGKSSSATPHLASAFDLYKSLGMMSEMDKARFLAGISKGEELKVEYLELVRKCDDDPVALRQLLEWKNRRIPFSTHS